MSPRFLPRLCAAYLFLAILGAGRAHCQSIGTYADVYNFGGTVTNADGTVGSDGGAPYAGVAFDEAGNMYGTTYSEGPNSSSGIVWEFTVLGSYLDLHDFGGSLKGAAGKTVADGKSSAGGVAVDSMGNLYGTTQNGGANGGGMVWELTPTGSYLDLHDFGGSGSTDGAHPWAGVAIDGSGNLYGTTVFGGMNGAGLVWEITASRKYVDLHDFGGMVKNANGIDGPDGANPYGGVTIDSDGDLFGTTQSGGGHDVNILGNLTGAGMVWEITASGPYLDLHDFGGIVTNATGAEGVDGFAPAGGVAIDANGDLFGTTLYGGPNLASNYYEAMTAGMVWEITQYPFRHYLDLHDFGEQVSDGNNAYVNGMMPWTGVTLDSLGNLYGTTRFGGPNVVTILKQKYSAGMVWEIPASGPFTDLHDFGGMSGYDGALPYSGVTIDGFGNLCGTTQFGGYNDVDRGGDGIVWGIFSGTPPLQNLYLSPPTLVSGNSAIGTVEVVYPAPAGGLNVSLASNSGSAVVPQTVTLPQGATFATFNIDTTGVNSQTSATITAKSGVWSVSATLTDNPADLISLGVSPSVVVGGNTATGTVTLDGPAGPKGAIVALSSSATAASAPPTVTVASGQSTATFTVHTSGVGAPLNSIIAATLNGKSFTTAISINPASLATVAVSPSIVTGGSTVNGTVFLSGNAASSGVTVTLESNCPDVIVPASLSLASGQSQLSFSIKTLPVTSQKVATIIATSGAVSTAATLVVNPPTLQSLTLSPNQVSGGNTTTGAITLTGPASTGGILVKLASNSLKATLPASVRISSGKISATFMVKTAVVATLTTITLGASLGTATQTAALTIDPPTLESVSVSPASVVGMTSSIGSVTLSGDAPAGGVTVQLYSNQASASVPTSVKIPAGSTHATFAVKTSSVAAVTLATVTGTLNGLSNSAKLTINPPELIALSVNPTSIIGGSSSTGTVTIGTPAPVGGLLIGLSSNIQSAMVPATISVLAGKRTANFQVTTKAVAAQSTALISASLGSVTKKVSLTVKK